MRMRSFIHRYITFVLEQKNTNQKKRRNKRERERKRTHPHTSQSLPSFTPSFGPSLFRHHSLLRSPVVPFVGTKPRSPPPRSAPRPAPAAPPRGRRRATGCRCLAAGHRPAGPRHAEPNRKKPTWVTGGEEKGVERGGAETGCGQLLRKWISVTPL